MPRLTFTRTCLTALVLITLIATPFNDTLAAAPTLKDLEQQLKALQAQVDALVQKKPNKQRVTAGEVSSPGLIFFDDFETGNFSKTMNGFKWEDKTRISVVRDDQFVVHNDQRPVLTGPISGRRWENTPASSGHHALRFRYEKDEPMTELRYKLGAAYKDIWLSYWIRVPLSYKHLNGPSTDNQKFAAIWMDAYSDKGTGGTCIPSLVLNKANDGGSKIRSSCATTYDDGVRHYGDFDRSDLPTTDDFIRYPQDQGRWMHVVQHYKASSARGNRDGVIELWRRWQDETTYTKFIESKDEPAYLPSVPAENTNGFSAGYLMGWANSHYATNTEFLIDDVTFSTTSLLPEGVVPTIPFTPNSTTIVTPPSVASAPTLTFSTTSSSLTWSTTNATTCTASGDSSFTGTKSRSGTQAVTPTVTTTYNLTCTGSGGSVTKSVTVAPSVVSSPITQATGLPVIIFSATPTISPRASALVRLTWSTQQANKCIASNTAEAAAWNGSKVASSAPHTIGVRPLSTAIYTLTCTGPGGSATQSVTVTVAGTGVPTTTPPITPPPPASTTSPVVTPTPATTPTPTPEPTTPTQDTPRSSGGGGGSSKSKSDRYQTTSILNVRSAPGITAASIGTQQTGAQGTLTESPITKDGHTWYHVNYDNGADGWSTGLYLKKITSTETKTTATNDTKTSKSCTTKAKYTKNTKVTITKAKTPVRDTPNGTILKGKKLNAQGTITKDPTCTDTTIWYYVDFKSGVDGYVRETRLKK